jgi:hypothetical protein
MLDHSRARLACVAFANGVEAGERMRIQFRAEAFNLTNSPTFNPPGSNIDRSSGGVVTSTLSPPRNIQLALKFNF